MVAKVRQRAFRILLPTDTERELFTENIGPCTGVAGTDGNGAGFLCHFDGKRSTLALDEILKILKQNGVDLKSLKVRVISNSFDDERLTEPRTIRTTEWLSRRQRRLFTMTIS
jgi:hypothetical protein